MEELLQSMSAEGGKLLANWGPKLLGAIFTLIIGRWVIRLIMRGVENY